ncbi:hypothetical protein CB1_000467002 [Camelus ferus]|nr:hypothetical protein CB1_000467002 [Camelus ferus]
MRARPEGRRFTGTRLQDVQMSTGTFGGAITPPATKPFKKSWPKGIAATSKQGCTAVHRHEEEDVATYEEALRQKEGDGACRAQQHRFAWRAHAGAGPAHTAVSPPPPQEPRLPWRRKSSWQSRDPQVPTPIAVGLPPASSERGSRHRFHVPQSYGPSPAPPLSGLLFPWRETPALRRAVTLASRAISKGS